MCCRRDFVVYLRISIPAITIDPAVTSYKRGNKALIVVLPEPEAPTTPVKDPASAKKDKFLRTSPESTNSGFAIASREANEISEDLG